VVGGGQALHTESREALRRNCGALSELGPTVPRLKSKPQRRIRPDLMDYVLTYATDRIRNRIMRYVFTARVFTILTRTWVEKAETIKEANGPINI
jgi:hypothetical protein